MKDVHIQEYRFKSEKLERDLRHNYNLFKDQNHKISKLENDLIIYKDSNNKLISENT